MKFFFSISGALTAVLFLFTQCADQNKKEALPKEKSPGVYSISFNDLYLEVNGNEGARVSSLRLNDNEILSADMGSIFWTSPQSDWGWPPRTAFHSDPYEGGIKRNTISLTSTTDSLLGFAVRKEFSGNPGDNSFTIIYTIINNDIVEKSVAPWEITRVLKGGLTFYPAGEKRFDFTERTLQHGAGDLPTREHEGITWFDFHPSRLEGLRGKLFSDGSEGWIAHADRKNRIILIKTFPEVPLSEIAPGEGEIEIYTDPDHDFVEVEQQGAVKALAPGQSYSWEVKWFVRALPEEMNIEPANMELVEFVRKTLSKK